ncbi:sperm-associated antigen 8 [Ctenodactylus gundi]
METNGSTEGSRSRSLDVQPSSERLDIVSQPFPSDGSSRSALAAVTTAAASAASAAAASAAASAASAAAASAAASTTKAAALHPKTLASYSEFTEPSSDSLEAVCAGSHLTGRGSLDSEPVYVSCIAQDPYTTTDLSCGRVTGSGSGPVPTSGSGPGSGYVTSSSSGPGHGSVPGSSSGPGHDSGPDHGSSQATGPASGTGPHSDPGPELSPKTPQRLRNLRPDLLPNYTSQSHHCPCEPQKQSTWEFLQVSEPGARGLWKPAEVERKPQFLCETLPRGRCLLNNWEEEKATNHLDQVPSSQDGSESFFFRHGHQGLLTIQVQSCMSSSTTQKDAYQPPRNLHQPLRGKREAMLEMLLYHQICKEVQAEQEPTRKLFEVHSVTHHDYRMELAQAGPPDPTKPHNYQQEQPETFWIQRASQLPGVSNIRTLDTPFRKNCSFSTPVPLSLGQPLPYEPETYPNQMGKISSIACQGRGKEC